ncbi:hypothetical protein KP509_28G026100 [Ceratopteris richardii]|uniref:Uncharacterized protein n=1 Tax=Ceratopteris richardii TaxID=49495 RepID=A0A8T2RBT4_CERRI|nr:hypothetical protein KP509_28G026100 [Ceratopteris richardii]
MATFGCFAGLATAALSALCAQDPQTCPALRKLAMGELSLLLPASTSSSPSSKSSPPTAQNNSSSSPTPPPPSPFSAAKASAVASSPFCASYCKLAPQFDGVFCFETLITR